MTNPNELRERWLADAVDALTPLFKRAEMTLPPVRVSTGWPSAGGLRERNRVLGQCWKPEAAADGVSQIFITPWLSDGVEVLGVLTHELIHAVKPEARHGAEFKEAAKAVGLAGKPTHTSPGPELLEELTSIAEGLGAYPHAKLDKVLEERKPQTTRMRKIACPRNGDREHHAEGSEYTLRGSAKVIALGVPDCPVCGYEMAAELPEEKEGE